VCSFDDKVLVLDFIKFVCMYDSWALIVVLVELCKSLASRLVFYAIYTVRNIKKWSRVCVVKDQVLPT
jgi:hypothetical protein